MEEKTTTLTLHQDHESGKPETLDAIRKFIYEESEQDFFILDGAAGTGKTTLVKSVTDLLRDKKTAFTLLAPTGRAASVLAAKTEQNVRTLHSFLYRLLEHKDKDGQVIRIEFIPKNRYPDLPVILIIDESSMISDVPSANDLFVSKTSVLGDLIRFYGNCPQGSKLIFVGDNYQLPPVEDDDLSPALSPGYLAKFYQLKGKLHKLTQVFRQQRDSYILQNALMLRLAMDKGNTYFNNLRYKNLYRIELAISQFVKLYDHNDNSKVIFLGWKNRVVQKLNRAIRSQLYGNPQEPLVAGEQIILNRSYFGEDLIPTGETATVLQYYPERLTKVAGTIFGEARFRFTLPSGRTTEIDAKFYYEYLLADDLAEDPEKTKLLWADRYRRNPTFRETQNKSDDPYLSALKIRYGYAITTHKAQGGEWDKVILYPEFPFDKNRLKWIYTAVTRGREEVFSY
jgi:exodeoxyribonuclease V